MSENDQRKPLDSNPYDTFYQGIPFFGRFLRSDTRLRNFPFYDANQRMRLVMEYQLKVGIDAEKLPTGSLFDSFNTNFIAEANAFTDVKAPDGTLLSKALADKQGQAEAKAVEDAIRSALADSKAVVEKATFEFTEDLNALKERVQQKTTSTADALSYLDARKTQALKALDKAHEDAKKRLETSLNDAGSDLNTNLQKVMNIAPSQVGGIKNAMLAEMDKKHKETKEAAEKAFTESTDTFSKDNKRREEEAMFVAALYESSNRMKDVIDKLIAEKNATQKSMTQLTTDVDIGGITLKDISIGDLPFVALGTGVFPTREINLKKNKDNKIIGVEMEMPSSLNIPYWMDPRSNAESDIMRIVTVLCVVCEKPNVKVTHDDPEVAMQMGRLAYSALRKNGKSDEECFVYVNGQKKSGSDLFAGRDAQLAAINDAANKLNEAKSTAQVKDTKNSVSMIRKDIAGIRAEKEAAKTPAPTPGPSP